MPWECRGGPMLRVGDAPPWRKHDWPDRRWRPVPPRGHQASDSLLATWRGQSAILQSFDFGDGDRRFGRFDAGAGDGGQLLLRVTEGVAIAMTEDGAGGVQWFQRPDCRPGGWLVAGPVSTRWREAVVPLHLRRGPEECPAALDHSLTRWRSRSTALPWRRPDGAAGTLRAPTLVSEHYSHPSVAASDHLERSWFARGLGLVRWERWEVAATPAQHARAEDLAASGRCPRVAGDGAPGPRWRRVDCRMWTNFVPGGAAPEPWPAAAQ